MGGPGELEVRVMEEDGEMCPLAPCPGRLKPTTLMSSGRQGTQRQVVTDLSGSFPQHFLTANLFGGSAELGIRNMN